MQQIRLLLVDDDELVRLAVSGVLSDHGFEVTEAANVAEALKCISAGQYDVLLSDLHMPGAGDGLTVVSAMRHANPRAVTMLLSAFPEMNAATQAILLQADQILVKPMNLFKLVAAIKERLKLGPPPERIIKSPATILEDEVSSTVEAWFKRVERDPKIMAVSLTREKRTGYLPTILADLVSRLRCNVSLGSKELISIAAHDHGIIRRKQGYSAAIMVEESRMLQVSIFETLRNNMPSIDFSLLLDDVMIIADEVDSQLSQAMESYNVEALENELPA